jgi:hypothetical protein
MSIPFFWETESKTAAGIFQPVGMVELPNCFYLKFPHADLAFFPTDTNFISGKRSRGSCFHKDAKTVMYHAQ